MSADKPQDDKKTRYSKLEQGLADYFEPSKFKESFLAKMRKVEAKKVAKQEKQARKEQAAAREAQNPWGVLGDLEQGALDLAINFNLKMATFWLNMGEESKLGTYDWKPLARSNYPRQCKEMDESLDQELGKDVPTMSKEQMMQYAKEKGIPTMSEEQLIKAAKTMDTVCMEKFTQERETKLTVESTRSKLEKSSSPTISQPPPAKAPSKTRSAGPEVSR